LRRFLKRFLKHCLKHFVSLLYSFLSTIPSFSPTACVILGSRLQKDPWAKANSFPFLEGSAADLGSIKRRKIETAKTRTTASAE
jgi:hypothetical protein